MTRSSPSNLAKDAFRLMDLLNELKIMPSAIVEYYQDNAKDLKDAAAKLLLVMSNALDLIVANRCKGCRAGRVRCVGRAGVGGASMALGNVS